MERKKKIIYFLITEWSLFVKSWVPFTQGCFVPSLVEIGRMVLEKKIFYLLKYFTSPRKRAWPFIWTNLNPLYPRMLCAVFGWNWPSGSWEEDENVKSLQVDPDDGQQVIRKAHLSFQLRWAKNLLKIPKFLYYF